jgi:hypothetical protein
MNRFICICFIIIMSSPAFPQYSGGTEDGYAFSGTGQCPVNFQDLYCSGGRGDGSAFTRKSPHPLNDQEIYCTGYMHDGFAFVVSGNVMLNNQVFYCTGGDEDGFARMTVSGHLFNSTLCYQGGDDDGSSILSTGFATFYDQAFYQTGGANDGYSSVYSGHTNICFTELYASGGSGDGFNDLNYYGPMLFSPAWSGGIADGFAITHSTILGISPAFFCLGGENDGAFSLTLPVTYFGNGIWLGASNTSWNNPANWSFSYLPDLSVNVLIPSGRSYYPLITSGNLAINNPQGNYKCKSLTILQGGSLVNHSNLYILGDVTVSGLYRADDQVNNEIVINPGGNLKLVAPGEMKVGD